MTKLRVHEIAKTLNKTNKEVIDFLREQSVEVSSHMSSLTEEQVRDIYDQFVAQHRRTTLYFVEQVNRVTPGILAEHRTDDQRVGNIVTAFAVVAGLSRMATEKLLLMQEPEKTK